MNPADIENLIDKKIQQYNRATLKLPRHTHNRVDSQPLDPIFFLKYPTLIAPNTIVVKTNGMTAVNIFPNGLPFSFTYTAVLSIALDTTAGNITVNNTGNIVTTIAKGTTAGAVIGSTSLNTNGALTTSNLSGGTTYSNATNVATTGGSGTGLTVNTTTSLGVITSIKINNPGINYVQGDTITITGGSGTATFKVASLTPYPLVQNANTSATVVSSSAGNSLLIIFFTAL